MKRAVSRCISDFFRVPSYQVPDRRTAKEEVPHSENEGSLRFSEILFHKSVVWNLSGTVVLPRGPFDLLLDEIST